VLMLLVTFYHMALGVQVVIEDYVHTEWTKITLLVLNKFACCILAAAGIFAVLRIAFQS
jgi:succinate dehydrogenase / fumarate reductase, membrane anchor subunit